MSATPAQDLAAERAVLAAMMLSGDAVRAAASTLHPKHFYREAHRKMFNAMVAMELDARPVDLVTLAAELQTRGHFESVGGAMELATVMEMATTTANLAHHAALVREAWRQREVVRLGALVAESAADKDAIASALAEMAELEDSGSASDDRWNTESCWGDELLTRDIVRPEAIIGDGGDGAVLSAGGVGFLVAAGGSGKTFLVLQLARAVSLGEPWLGLPTERVAVGMVEGEMTEYACQERLRKLSESGHEPWLSSVRILSKPRGGMVLRRTEVRARLRRFVIANGLKLCILDPLNRFHDFGEKNVGGEQQTLSVLQEIADETGCAFFILHHVRKLPPGSQDAVQSRVSDMHQAKGGSSWSDDADCMLTLAEHGKDGSKLHVLRFSKVRHGIEPEARYLARTDSGYFVMTESPEERAVNNRVRLEQLLAVAGVNGLSTEEAMQASGLSKSTVKGKLSQIGAKSICVAGKGRRGSRWYLPEFAPLGIETDMESE